MYDTIYCPECGKLVSVDTAGDPYEEFECPYCDELFEAHEL